MHCEEYQKRIGISFRDSSILEQALTHSSCCRENGLPQEQSYERMEFLGDAYLDAFISKNLFARKAHVDEGSLTKLRAEIVCERALVQVAEHLQIKRFLNLGKGEEKSGGRNKSSILADVVESTIAAILLDAGIEEAEKFVVREFEPLIEAAICGNLFADYKSQVQEILQSKSTSPEIQYITEGESGPDHKKIFQVRLECNGKILGTGSGKSKKEAQQNAARDAIEQGRLENVF